MVIDQVEALAHPLSTSERERYEGLLAALEDWARRIDQRRGLPEAYHLAERVADAAYRLGHPD